MKNVDRFNEWMKNVVKNIYYANNEMMCNAYKKIEE